MKSTFVFGAILFILLLTWVFYKAENRIINYIPSILLLIGISVFGFKYLFFQQGYSGLVDIAVIMLLSMCLIANLIMIFILKRTAPDNR